MVDGVATFQLQFDWELCTKHLRASPGHPKRILQGANHSASKRRTSGVQSKFTADEELIIKLKKELQPSWTEIRQRTRHNTQSDPKGHFRSDTLRN